MSLGYEVNSGLFSEAAGKAVKKELRGQAWTVYEHYEKVEEDGRTFVVSSPGESRNMRDDAKIIYAPMRNPDLVVDLALMADTPITPDAVLIWARQYGLMGFPEDDVVYRYEGNGHWGFGRRDDVARFAQAAKEVGKCVRIYEALMTDSSAETLREIVEELWSPEGPLPAKALAPRRPFAGSERPYLFGVLGKMVSMRVREHCYPKLMTYTTGGRRAASSHSRGASRVWSAPSGCTWPGYWRPRASA